MTNAEANQWLLDNPHLVTQSTKMDKETAHNFFAAYNALSPVKKGVTTCGRCIHNMRQFLQAKLKELENMKKFDVYRTAKGNLSFQKRGESIMTIRSTTGEAAKEALAQLKVIEKRTQKKIDSKDV